MKEGRKSQHLVWDTEPGDTSLKVLDMSSRSTEVIYNDGVSMSFNNCSAMWFQGASEFVI